MSRIGTSEGYNSMDSVTTLKIRSEMADKSKFDNKTSSISTEKTKASSDITHGDSFHADIPFTILHLIS